MSARCHPVFIQRSWLTLERNFLAGPNRRRQAFVGLAVRHARGVVPLLDSAFLWTAALFLATAFRNFTHVAHSENHLSSQMVFVAAAGTQLAVGRLLGIYAGRWRIASFEEVTMLAAVVLATTAVVVGVSMGAGSRSAVAGGLEAGTFALLGMWAFRSFGRYYLIERPWRPSPSSAIRVVVVGAGEGGVIVIRTMIRLADSQMIPVALVDDDVRKSQRRILGVRVMGTRAELANVAIKVDASMVVFAIPSADAFTIRQTADEACRLRLKFRVLPPLERMIENYVVPDRRPPLTPADLLGRRVTQLDVRSAAAYLEGKRILITGAGGSIGSELCRQVKACHPARLAMLDRDESALHAVQLSLDGRALLDTPDLIVADIRDSPRLRAIFADQEPHVVFHAAALKHLPLLEMHPTEALKTNVVGTLNVLEAAAAVRVERLVNISTDKAAHPTSVLGLSKRITERLTAGVGAKGHGTFVSVRFGNVLGSRGSMLTTFAAQIDAGGPVTVTHPDVTRFFMTIEEAVMLIVEAGAIGGSGETLVLDMGAAVSIARVARRLVAQSGQGIEIVYTGLRPGEKLHEVLFSPDERDVRPKHPLISHVPVPPLDPEVIRGLIDEELTANVKEKLREIADSAPASNPAALGQAVGGSYPQPPPQTSRAGDRASTR